jgi:hypothetical protein
MAETEESQDEIRPVDTAQYGQEYLPFCFPVFPRSIGVPADREGLTPKERD